MQQTNAQKIKKKTRHDWVGKVIYWELGKIEIRPYYKILET